MRKDFTDLLRKADDLKQKGRLYKAITLYEEILSEIDDSELLEWLRITLADLYFWVKEFDKAKNLVMDNINQDPQEAFNYYFMGFLLIGEGKFYEAKEYFNMAYKIESENPEYLRGLGLVEFLLDNFDTAEKILREVLKRDPENNAARDNLIELLIRIGKIEEAEKEISEFRRKDPKDWQILYRVQELKNKKEEIKKGGSL